MSKKLFFLAPVCALLLTLASCSLFSDVSDEKGPTSVNFTIDSRTAQTLLRQAGIDFSDSTRASIGDLHGLYINLSLRGQYPISQFAQITANGVTIAFANVPAGLSVYAYAEIYSDPSNVLYKGKSDNITIIPGFNNLTVKIMNAAAFNTRYPDEPANTNNPAAPAPGSGGNNPGNGGNTPGSGEGGNTPGTGGGNNGGNGGDNGNGENGGSGGNGSGTGGDPNGGNGNSGNSNPQGMTYGEYVQMPFSVAADKQVYFSPGNLWYQASSSTFKFAENQYDIVGKDANEAAFTAFISNDPTSYTGWTDLFEWGSSGAGIAGIEYPPYTRKFPDGLQNALHVPAMTDQYAELDWGVHNPISNGGNQPGQWRTLTLAEWNYLLHSRSGAPSKRAPARVNGIAGMILFPDTWNPGSMPNGITLNYTNSQNSSDTYGTNTYTALEFSQLEALGAVFLPSTGTCYSVYSSDTAPSWDGVDGSNAAGSGTIYVAYYTATAYSAGSDTKYKIYTSNGGYNKADIGTYNGSANAPAAVRLTQDRQDYYVVPSVNPSQLYVSPTGTETGDGSESNPLDTIAHAVTKIKSFSEAQDYTIFIDGTITTAQEIKNISKAYAKSITVKGKNGLNESTHEPNDALAGSYSYGSNAKMLLIETAVPVIVEDLKISGGYASTGGGVSIGSSTVYSDVTLSSGTLITGNKSSGNGAGVYVTEKSKLTIDGAVIKANSAEMYPATAHGIGVYSRGKELVIKGNSKITGNTCNETSGNYSAVFCQKGNDGDTVTIQDNAEISNNEVRGLYINGVPLTLKGNCKITGNQNQSTSSATGSNGGGGIYATAGYETYEINISENAEISGNSAKNAGGLCIYSTNVTVNFSGGSISGNTLTDASGKGKGVYLYMGTVTADRFTMSGTAVIASNNDIYLAGDNAKITAGSLTPPAGITTVATITPYNNTYSDTKQVLNGSLAGAYQLFAVTPDSSSSPSTPWYVGSNGYLTQTQP